MTSRKPQICRLCFEEVKYIFSQTILQKYKIEYFRCVHCDLIQTEEAYWLEDAYSEAISSLDTGAINRNELVRELVLHLFDQLGLENPHCLDFGGGHGVYTRMMRDVGLDFRWYDKHASNNYARGFEASLSNKFDVVTTFEVFEHLAKVKEELSEIFETGADYIIVGTVLHSGHEDGWWYYLPETGQHMAFYSAKTMEYIAQMYDMNVIAGPKYTLFYRKNIEIPPINERTIQLLLGIIPIPLPFMGRIKNKILRLINKKKTYQRESLIMSDYSWCSNRCNLDESE